METEIPLPRKSVARPSFLPRNMPKMQLGRSIRYREGRQTPPFIAAPPQTFRMVGRDVPPMRRMGSSQTTGAAILIVGIMVGAALIFGTLYATGSLSPRTTTETSSVMVTTVSTFTTVSTLTLVTTVNFSSSETFTSGQNMQLIGTTCVHGAAATAYCQLQLTNTGEASAAVVGCSIYGASATSAPTLAHAQAGTQATVVVVAGTTSANPVTVYCAGPALTAGAAVSGSLAVASGSPLAFSAIAS